MSTSSSGPLAPGVTIGILGGGQLGRMTAMAAARLGYPCHVYTDETDSPAAQVAAKTTVASYTDEAALAAFAKEVAVVTFEFENIPEVTAATLARHVVVRPGPRCLAIAQDRLREKDFLNSIGTATAPYRRVTSVEDLTQALHDLGRPAVLKTARLGYDGKGQVMIDGNMKPAAAWKAMGAAEGVLEGFVDFEREISVIVARGPDGNWAAFDPVENRHVHHVLDTTIAPAAIAPELADKAIAMARHIAERLDLVGLLAVEMFVTREGALLVNELAPRPHNSGHWTIDACLTSQFEQFVRAVCGLPLGATQRHSDATMKNLLGDEVLRWREILAEPGAKLHLYGKTEPRPGRKMGHVTRLSPRK
ncbi:MAG TPA: 5-(carboxyamino)imidazole ribonucleotide synthase [Alphaproteobacteria bacterium]|jgi:5-(carboxyamino)imidazole ribonucleotide synthase